MISIIITAIIATTLSTALWMGIFHKKHGVTGGSDTYKKAEEVSNPDDFLIFEEQGTYRATDIKNDMLYKRLKELMEVSRPYLNPKVRMNDIATAIGTNTSTLSSIINRRFNMSFTDLINSYRVRYALEYITKDPDVTSENLKRMCGFNTTSTYTNAFHRHTGMTPGEYLKKYKAKL